MKKSILTFTFAITFFAPFRDWGLFAQTIRRCNNNPGITGTNVYTTIQAAHDAAVAGDIVYVEPSNTEYNSVNVTKRLTIIGGGYNKDNPALTISPSDQRASTINSITFGIGSENSLITGIYVSFSVSINVGGINITRCKIGTGVSFGTVSLATPPYTTYYGNSAKITQCILVGGASLGSPFTYFGPGFYCNFQNNISQGFNGFNNSSFLNNTLFGQIAGVGACTVTNNIFALACCSAVTGNSNSVSNNIGTIGTTLPTGDGNINGATLSTIFINSSVNNAGSYIDSDYRLSTNSPARGIGTGGTDAGAFGGNNPYILSGLPPYPIITNFTNSGAGNTTTPLQVSVTVRSNN